MSCNVLSVLSCILQLLNSSLIAFCALSLIDGKKLLNTFPNRLKRKVADHLYNYLTSFPKSIYVSNFPDVSLGKRFLDKWFYEPAIGVFENESMPLPSNPHEYLAYEFGDYMQLPPIEKRKIHHDYIFTDFDNSYINYKGVKYCVK